MSEAVRRPADNAGPLPTRVFGGVPALGPVEILVDRWGIPHIYAGSERDGYVAQGFNAARDRLWQIDLWRRRGLGLLAEVLGSAFLDYDRAARLFLYRGPMTEEWTSYGNAVRNAIESFVTGINAYIEQARHDETLLPPEFGALGYQPSLWSADDVVRIRWHGRYRNLLREVARARLVRDDGLGADRLRALLGPDLDLTVPEGLDLSVIDDSVLDDYELATGPLDLSALGASAVGPLAGPEGSNAWVVAPHRTATGRPLLAGDPHRAMQVPALRYAVHVETPGLSFIGAGEPQLPGISMGHNGQIAFGLTVLPLDQEDLYVYQLDQDDKNRYRYGDGFESMQVEEAEIPVRGSDPVMVELRFTRHGPIVHESADGQTAFAVRAAWLGPGMAPYAASLAMLHARTWEAFRTASRRWRAPGSNLMYADADGHIGWQPRIGAPVRPNWPGLLPVPGDGRYEWNGLLDPDLLPSEYDPPRGWIASANELNLGEDLLRASNLGFEFEPPNRYQRVAEVLSGGPPAGVSGALALQADCLSLPARALLPLLADVQADDPDGELALSLLSDWDGRLRADSAAAAVFEVWLYRELRPALLARALTAGGEHADPAGTVARLLALSEPAGDARIEIALLAHAVDTDRAGQQELLSQTLAAAIGRLTTMLGPDWRTWSWGRLHQLTLSHPLEPLLDDESRKLAALPPVPRSGSAATVGCTGYSQGGGGPNGYLQDWGASFRMVIDVGSWDESVAINTPGQAGDPRSLHYGDLLPVWAADGAVPLLFTRARVKAASQERILLTPAEPAA